MLIIIRLSIQSFDLAQDVIEDIRPFFCLIWLLLCHRLRIYRSLQYRRWLRLVVHCWCRLGLYRPIPHALRATTWIISRSYLVIDHIYQWLLLWYYVFHHHLVDFAWLCTLNLQFEALGEIFRYLLILRRFGLNYSLSLNRFALSELRPQEFLLGFLVLHLVVKTFLLKLLELTA